MGQKLETEREVLDRAVELGLITKKDKITLAMDLEAANVDMSVLLMFTDNNFIHDVMGTMRHIDRRTGELTDCFLPRSSKDYH